MCNESKSFFIFFLLLKKGKEILTELVRFFTFTCQVKIFMRNYDFEFFDFESFLWTNHSKIAVECEWISRVSWKRNIIGFSSEEVLFRNLGKVANLMWNVDKMGIFLETHFFATKH